MRNDVEQKNVKQVSLSTPLLFAYVALAAVLFETAGHYKYESVMTVMGIYAVIIACYVLCLKKRLSFAPPSVPALAAALLVLLYIPSTRSPGLYLEVSWFSKFWHITVLMSAAAIFFTYVVPLSRKEWCRVTVFVLACIAAAGFRLWILHASPNPRIDVYRLNQTYTSVLLAGKNPYATPQLIVDTSRKGDDTFLRLTGYDYFPGNLYVFVLSRLMSKDSRLATVLCELFAAALLYASTRWRYSRKHAELFCLLFLFQPSALFVTEQAWTEPLIFPFFLVFLLQARKRFDNDAAAALGFVLCLKQYLVFLPFQALLLIRKRSAWLTAGVVMLLVAGPFLLWDAGKFYDNTIAYFFHLPLRKDSLSFASYLIRDYGVTLPKFFAIGLSALAAVLTAIGARSFERVTGFLFCVVLTMFTMFIFATQSFANYYYFLSFLLLCLLCFQAEKLDEASKQ